MNIPSAKYLKIKMRNRLQDGKNPKEVILYYAAISAGAAFLVTAIQYALEQQISTTGGLHNIGTRSILSTAGNVLPILQAVLLLCLNLGYLAAMLRISRRQFASAKTLKAGAERFWTLLGSRILQSLIYIGVMLAASFVAVRVFLLTPFSREFDALIAPMAAAGTLTPEMLMENTLVLDSLYSAMLPMMGIYLVLLLPVWVYISYMFRLVDYIIIDNPQARASFALRQSRILMRGNKFRLFKVDLSFWWYYLIRFVISILLYADTVLAIFGIFLPFSDFILFFGTVIIYLAADFAANYYLRNKIEVTYALAYTSIAPKPEAESGAVLGNIFQM